MLSMNYTNWSRNLLLAIFAKTHQTVALRWNPVPGSSVEGKTWKPVTIASGGPRRHLCSISCTLSESPENRASTEPSLLFLTQPFNPNWVAYSNCPVPIKHSLHPPFNHYPHLHIQKTNHSKTSNFHIQTVNLEKTIIHSWIHKEGSIFIPFNS